MWAPEHQTLRGKAMSGIAYAMKWGDVTLSYRYLAFYGSGDQLVQSLRFKGPALSVTFRFQVQSRTIWGLLIWGLSLVLEATISDGHRKKQFRGYGCIDGQLATGQRTLEAERPKTVSGRLLSDAVGRTRPRGVFDSLAFSRPFLSGDQPFKNLAPKRPVFPNLRRLPHLCGIPLP